MCEGFRFPDVGSIVDAQQMSVFLEVSGEPKPGNVTEDESFPEISYVDFVEAAIAMREPLVACYRDAREREDASGSWGDALWSSCEASMMEGRNTIFGTLLLEIPLGLGAALALESQSVVGRAGQVVDGSGVGDSIAFCRSARFCGVGGLDLPLGCEARELDLLDPGIEEKLKRDSVTLRELLLPSVGYDLLAAELVGGYGLTRRAGRAFLRSLRERGDPRRACGETFIWLLSVEPDSLIARTAGESTAELVRSRAVEVERREPFSEEWVELADDLDRFLRDRDLNPGALADITAAGIFLALLGEAG